jgi:hypothetical protein
MVPFHPYAMTASRPAPQTENKAVLSLVLGLSSLACIGVVAGLPAIVLGALARRDIDRSNGTLQGRALAVAGIISGLFGTGLGVVMLLWLMGAAFAPSTTADRDSALRTQKMTLNAPEGAEGKPTSDQPPVTAPSPSVPSGTRSYGSLEVVDLDASRPLRAQLGEIVRRARGRTVVLQTVVRSSSACLAVAAALPDTRMQRALANVTLVRVDVDEYDRELGAMKVETKSAPWFYKLDTKGEPTTDAISADAWEANLPENMAPVLGKFVHRATAVPRRHH